MRRRPTTDVHLCHTRHAACECVWVCARAGVCIQLNYAAPANDYDYFNYWNTLCVYIRYFHVKTDYHHMFHVNCAHRSHRRLSLSDLPYFLETEFALFLCLWTVLVHWMAMEQRQLAVNIKHLWQLSLDDSSYWRNYLICCCGLGGRAGCGCVYFARF